MVRKMGIVLLIVLFFSIILAYFKNEGSYLLKKYTRTEVELLRDFTKFQFPDSTIINTMTIEGDTGSYFFSHNEVLRAIVSVPSNEIDKLFPETYRSPYEYAYSGHELENGEEREFMIFSAHAVTKWFDKTQRSIYITAVRPKDKYTKVYVSVDKLGWNWYQQ